MKDRTHFNIVRLSLKNSTNTSFRGKLYQKMYCIGAMLPETPPQKLKPIPTSYFMYLKTLSDGRG